MKLYQHTALNKRFVPRSVEINNLGAYWSGALNACSPSDQTHRNLRRGLSKNPVELSVGRNVGNAHREQIIYGRVGKRRGVVVENASDGMMCSAKTRGRRSLSDVNSHACYAIAIQEQLHTNYSSGVQH